MSDDFKLVFQRVNGVFSVGDGATGGVIGEPRDFAFAGMIAIDAYLSGDECNCMNCSCLRLARDILQKGSGLKTFKPGNGVVLDKAKLC